MFRVKNCVTAIDPEREKEQKEKAESQTIRANEVLSRKKEKVNRKYTHSVRRERQLSPGFLEDALDEEEELDYYESRPSARRRFEEDLEMEARAEKRIINAKRSQGHKDIGRKSSASSMKSSRRPVDDYEEESEYETEEEERSPQHIRGEEPQQYDDDDDDEEEPQFNKHKGSGGGRQKHKRKEMDSDEEELESPSPPRKATTSSSHRRKALVYDSDED